MSRTAGALSPRERADHILACLEDGWTNYTTLVSFTGKPERTLRRDLQQLQQEGYQIESRWEGPCKWFRLRPGTRRRPIEPGILEVIAANLGRGLLGFLDGTELRDEMEDLFQQLRLSSRASERQLRDLDRKFWFMPDAPRNYQGCDEQLNELITCLLDQRAADLLYRNSEDQLRSVRIHPYSLIVRRECLYILAAVVRADGTPDDLLRLFDLTRIEDCRRLRAGFSLDEHWHPAAIFENSFGVFIPREEEANATRVRIWFEETVGRRIRQRRWHVSQTWSEPRGGGWQLEMHIRVCPELVHWLLGFGPSARVLEPVHLRRRVVQQLREGVKAYERAEERVL